MSRLDLMTDDDLISAKRLIDDAGAAISMAKRRLSSADLLDDELQESGQQRWLRIGIENGWISESYCSTHDWIEPTPSEDLLNERGDDYCVFVVRLGSPEQWEDDAAMLLSIPLASDDD